MIKVSVCTITYNHGPYIAQTIESVLMQRGPGLEIEMVIGDDVSSDNTREIIADYARRFPDNIKPLFHEINLGPSGNTQACMAACTGKYIAALEGDDYWIDPDKIRLQVEALEARPDYFLCVHDAETFNEADNSGEWTFGKKFSHILPPVGAEPCTFTQLDIVRNGWFLPTASMLIRATAIPQPLPSWFEGIYSGDYALQLLVTRMGPAIYLPRIMSRYRIHSEGVTSSKYTGEQMKKFVHENTHLHLLIREEYQKEAQLKFDTSLQATYFDLSLFHKHTNDLLLRSYYYFKAITVNRTMFSKHIMRILAKLTGKS